MLSSSSQSSDIQSAFRHHSEVVEACSAYRRPRSPSSSASPAIWVIYTLVFVYLSRGWKAEDVAEDRARLPGGGDESGGTAASANGGTA
jgi:hypothetical protein